MQNLDGEHGCGLKVRIRIVREDECSFHGDLVAVMHKDRGIDDDCIAAFPNLGVPVNYKWINGSINIEFCVTDSGIEVVSDGACNSSLELIVYFDIREGEGRELSVVGFGPNHQRVAYVDSC